MATATRQRFRHEVRQVAANTSFEVTRRPFTQFAVAKWAPVHRTPTRSLGRTQLLRSLAMRSTFAVAVALLLTPMAAFGQNSSARTSIASEILAANSAWARAILRQDPVALRQVMSPDYRLTFSSNPRSVDLTAWLQNFMKMKMRAYNPRVTHLRLLGADTVAATVSSNWEATLANGKPISETFTSVDTWQRVEGRWVAVDRRVVDLKVLDGPESN